MKALEAFVVLAIVLIVVGALVGAAIRRWHLQRTDHYADLTIQDGTRQVVVRSKVQDDQIVDVVATIPSDLDAIETRILTEDWMDAARAEAKDLNHK